MLFAFQAALAIIAVACVVYLILDSAEKDAFFPYRQLGKLFFPKLERYDQQKRMTLLAGIILFIITIAAVTWFAINHAAHLH